MELVRVMAMALAMVTSPPVAVRAAVSGGYSHTTSGRVTRPAVLVRAFNDAGVPADVLAGTRDKVRAIFEKAGVDMIWAEPRSGIAAGETTQAECQPFSIQVLIRARQVAGGPGRTHIMGLAVAVNDERAVLFLFYDAVTDVARRYDRLRSDILVIALAHEMGHALLPPPSHANTGIMQARWEGKHIRRAMVGSLAFSETQAAAIRVKAARGCAWPRVEVRDSFTRGRR